MSVLRDRDDFPRSDVSAGIVTDLPPGLGRLLEIASHSHVKAIEAAGAARSQRASEKAKDLLNATLDAMPTHVAILDREGRIVFVNASWRNFLTAASPSIPGHGIGAEYLQAGILGVIDRRHALALRVALAATLRGTTDQFRHTIRASMLVQDHWYQVSGVRFLLHGSARVVITHEDVSAVHAAQQTINDLSHRLLTLQEEERRRIAVELHDSTAQQLTAIGLYLMSLRRVSDPSSATQKVFDEIERSIDEAQKEIRSFSYLLHPPYLDRDGLKATLHRFVEGYARRTNLKATAQIASDVDGFTADAQRALLRIVQEALSNVHRHAAATDVLVKIRTTRRVLLLNIADNGRGIGSTDSPEEVRDLVPGLGLPGMHARVHQLGGTLKIFSGQQGTRVFGRIPLARCAA